MRFLIVSLVFFVQVQVQAQDVVALAVVGGRGDLGMYAGTLKRFDDVLVGGGVGVRRGEGYACVWFGTSVGRLGVMAEFAGVFGTGIFGSGVILGYKLGVVGLGVVRSGFDFRGYYLEFGIGVKI